MNAHTIFVGADDAIVHQLKEYDTVSHIVQHYMY